MILINGITGSGKSKLAIDILNDRKDDYKSLYLLLDKDVKTLNTLKKNGIDYTLMKNSQLLDIKYRILENGGLIKNNLDFVVIDSINLISDIKSYKKKIEYLLDIENDFNLSIISTMNVLRVNKKIIDSIKDIKGIDFIDL